MRQQSKEEIPKDSKKDTSEAKTAPSSEHTSSAEPKQDTKGGKSEEGAPLLDKKAGK